MIDKIKDKIKYHKTEQSKVNESIDRMRSEGLSTKSDYFIAKKELHAFHTGAISVLLQLRSFASK